MNNNEMTIEGTIRELRFALEHDVAFTKHDIFALLNRCEVEKVCNELRVRAELRAAFLEGYDGEPYRGYYVLAFYRDNEDKVSIGTYFGTDLVTKSMDYTIEPEEEE